MLRRPLTLLLLAWLAATDLAAAPRNTRAAATTSDDERTVAALRAGANPGEFKHACDNSSHLHFDRSNRALFACETLATGQIGPDTSPYISTASLPLDQTFRLHSLPGANLVIYLDFTGHTTDGTMWNTNITSGAAIISPAFDTDGNPAAFSDSERTAIQDIWRRVSEDYAPWDVDVTTEDPGEEAIRRTGENDTQWGVRCVIGGSSRQWLGGSAGGVAYVGTFGQTVDATDAPNDVPCFVFPTQLSNNPRYIGEAASHEIGHTLGLYHNGQTTGVEYYTGHADWAPIMGVGYYKTVTQWTKGDYPLSNNRQDQLAIIGSRIPCLTPATPSIEAISPALQNVDGNELQAGGIIASPGERHYFRIVAGPGTLSINGLVSSPSPNLKLALTLMDDAGNNLGGGMGIGMGSNLTLPVAGGVYYLVTDGTGTGTAAKGYTDYGSLGRYQLTGTWAAGTETPPSPGTNQKPVASTAGTTPVSGQAPLSVQFSGSGSSDPDGTVVGYLWDFGDGEVSTLANPEHIYATPGNYLAKLTLVDNGGATSTTTLSITVTPAASGKSLHVSRIAANLVIEASGKATAEFTVAVADGNGLAVPKARVAATVSGLVAGTGNASTGKTGEITFVTPRMAAGTTGSLTFRVTGISLSGSTYDPGQNVTTSKDLAVSIPEQPPKKKTDRRRPEH